MEVSGFRERMQMTFSLEEDDNSPAINPPPNNEKALVSTMLDVMKEVFAAHEELARRHRVEKQAHDEIQSNLKALQKYSAETAEILQSP
ncbi:MAG: hypothetical protein M1830_010054, partial [Pleopsidium flavum]